MLPRLQLVNRMKHINAIEFAKFSDGNLELWSKIVGAKIHHSSFGLGKIVNVEYRKAYIPLIHVFFENDVGVKMFNSETFKDGYITNIQITTEINSSLQNWKSENIKNWYQSDKSIRISGNWKEGWALDLHTLKSVPLPDGGFDTTYTDIGKSLKLLKYNNDYSQIGALANAVGRFMGIWAISPLIDVILPTPPSNRNRKIQPVYALADKISQIMDIPADFDYLIKKKDTDQLKHVSEKSEREAILSEAFDLLDLKYVNRKVLLFDDLYRSGSTLKEITRILYDIGKVNNVYVITLTKTRAQGLANK
jgi:competence protein ComFC